METWDADLVLDARCTLAEGPHWDPRSDRLLFVGIDDGEVHAWDPVSGDDVVHRLGQTVGSVVPMVNGNEAAVVLHDGIGVLDLATGELDVRWPIDAEEPDRRFNDAKADPQGRLWGGTLTLRGPNEGRGTVWRLNHDGSATAAITGTTIANGMAWLDGGRTLLFIDSATRRVDAFDIELETGTPSNRRTALALPDGHGSPDGCCLDAAGNLWIGLWDGGGARRYDLATGECTGFVRTPAPLATACAFGGPDLDTLYVTTARVSLPGPVLSAHPHSGGVFAAKVDIPGAAFHPCTVF